MAGLLIESSNWHGSAAIELYVSLSILNEIEGVLKRKFHWPPFRAREAVALIKQFTRSVEPRARISKIDKDEADNRILECAVAAGATVIISGDSHLLDLESFRGIQIVNARSFLDSMSV